MFGGRRDTMSMGLEKLTLELDDALLQGIVGCSLEGHRHIRAKDAAAALSVHGLAKLLQR